MQKYADGSPGHGHGTDGETTAIDAYCPTLWGWGVGHGNSWTALKPDLKDNTLKGCLVSYIK